jgi:hypothetical protein
MRPKTPPPAAQARLHAALLDFQRRFGKGDTGPHAPTLLFSAIPQILLIAAGKPQPGLSGRDEDELKRAACLFVRTALLHPQADHYALLGVAATADTATIKEHYRLLMRLVHPDFTISSPGAGWPADAAARLNLAYQALASQANVPRDGETDRDARTSPALTRRRPRERSHDPVRAHAIDRRRLLRTLAWSFGATGGVALLALLALGSLDPDNLVQRPLAATASPGSAFPPSSFPARDTAITQIPPATPDGATDVPDAPAAPVAAAALTAISPAVTLAQVHPTLSRLLQELESGSGERVLSLLDAPARSAPAAQALLRYYDSLVNGVRPVRVSNVRFKAEPKDGRLWVTGNLMLQAGDQTTLANAREMSVEAEFASRDGDVVMTNLRRARSAGPDAADAR